MSLKTKNIIYIVIFTTLVVTLMIGLRVWQMNKINSLIDSGDMVTGLLENPTSLNGVKYLIPPTDIFDAGNILPPINSPVFTTVSDADSYLADTVSGIDVEMNGQHRFYSYQILNWHEVVNDTFDNTNLAITHSTLCSSSAVYKTDLSLENAGLIYNNNELLKDEESDSIWSQIAGIAVAGKKIKTELEKYPIQIMTWSQWKEAYPNGEVLSINTSYERDYTSHPYNNYDIADITYFPLNNYDSQYAEKAYIQGYNISEKYLMISNKIMSKIWVWNGPDNYEVSVFDDIYNAKYRVYKTNIKNQRLTFTFDISNNIFIDDQTQSSWNIDGLSVSGELKGEQLKEVENNQSMFAMCWVGIHPDTIEILSDNSVNLTSSDEN